MPGGRQIDEVATEILMELNRPIAFCELEVQVTRKLQQHFVDIRPRLDAMCRDGKIKVVGTSNYGDALLEIPLLDKLASL